MLPKGNEEKLRVFEIIIIRKIYGPRKVEDGAYRRLKTRR